MDTRISTDLRLVSFLAFPLTITAIMVVTTGTGTLPGPFPIVATPITMGSTTERRDCSGVSFYFRRKIGCRRVTVTGACHI